MPDHLHWYTRTHGAKASRIVRAALAGELEASGAVGVTERPSDAAPAQDPVSTPARADAAESSAPIEADAPQQPSVFETPAAPLSIVAVSGSLHAPSKTTVLVRELLERFAEALAAEAGVPVETHLIELSDVGPEFSGALRRDQLGPAAEDAVRRIEQASLLIVGSPVYRASFTGLFKHVFDFVGQYALVDTPVLLAATGGSDRHALIIEHQFRPLFSFFQAITLPIGVYASDGDFTDYRITDPGLRDRIAQAVERGVPVVRATAADAEPLRADRREFAQPVTAG